MSVSLKKIAAGSMAALILAGSLTTASTPAAAWVRGGWGWGPAVGFGVLGGVAAGAIIASQAPYYGPGPYYGCTRLRPVYDGYGHYLGRRPVNVC